VRKNPQKGPNLTGQIRNLQSQIPKENPVNGRFGGNHLNPPTFTQPKEGLKGSLPNPKEDNGD